MIIQWQPGTSRCIPSNSSSVWLNRLTTTPPPIWSTFIASIKSRSSKSQSSNALSSYGGQTALQLWTCRPRRKAFPLKESTTNPPVSSVKPMTARTTYSHDTSLRRSLPSSYIKRVCHSRSRWGSLNWRPSLTCRSNLSWTNLWPSRSKRSTSPGMSRSLTRHTTSTKSFPMCSSRISWSRANLMLERSEEVLPLRTSIKDTKAPYRGRRFTSLGLAWIISSFYRITMRS